MPKVILDGKDIFQRNIMKYDNKLSEFQSVNMKSKQRKMSCAGQKDGEYIEQSTKTRFNLHAVSVKC